jgi:hypothetical protein
MNEQAFESYDYLKVKVEDDLCSQYIDGYTSLGWKPDENLPQEKSGSKVTLHMKRSRNILNKTELTRLQRHYESCMEEISALEASKTSVPTIAALSCGLIGCAFMAGSVFAVTAETPVIWLTVLLGIPGIALWAAAYFGYQLVKRRRAARVLPLIDAKYDEAYAVCEKAQQILGK